jgi:hypothetical protein
MWKMKVQKNEGREMTAGMLGHAVPMFHDSIAESS